MFLLLNDACICPALVCLPLIGKERGHHRGRVRHAIALLAGFMECVRLEL